MSYFYIVLMIESCVPYMGRSNLMAHTSLPVEVFVINCEKFLRAIIRVI